VACLELTSEASLRGPLFELAVLLVLASRRQLLRRLAALVGRVVLVAPLLGTPAGVFCILLHFLFKSLALSCKAVALGDKTLSLLFC